MAGVSAFAEKITLLPDKNNELDIYNISYAKVLVNNILAQFEIIPADNGFTVLSISDYQNFGDVGKPMLPQITRLIEIPQEAEIKILKKQLSYIDISLDSMGYKGKIFPMQAPQVKSDYAVESDFDFDSSFYAADSFNTNEPVMVNVLGTMRETRLAQVTVAPIVYNPVTNVVRIYTNIEVEILFENSDLQETQKKHRIYKKPQQNKLLKIENEGVYGVSGAKPMFGVPEALEKYVIIADTMYKNELQPFIQWKTMKGFEVLDFYTRTVGNTETQIKNFLTTLYNSATQENPAPSFVLLVGDILQIPTFLKRSTQRSETFYTDLYYSDYTNDNLPDVDLGRLSVVSTAELRNLVNKIIAMEKMESDLSYADTSMLLTGVDSDTTHNTKLLNTQTGYLAGNYFNPANKIYAKAYYCPYFIQNPFFNTIAEISKGAAIVAYTGHGQDGAWDNTGVDNYTVRDGINNKNKYYFAIANCCHSGKFAANCLGEAMTRNVNGAVSYIGASFYTYFNQDFYWAVGVPKNGTFSSFTNYDNYYSAAFDRLFHTHEELVDEWAQTAAQIMHAGCMSVQLSPSTNPMKHYYWEIYNLLGDPSYMPLVRKPKEIEPAIPVKFDINQSQIIVKIPPYTKIALSKNNELFAAAVADEDGFAHLNLNNINQTGDYDVVISGQHIKTYIGKITAVDQSIPVVVFDGLQVYNEHDVAVKSVCYGANYGINTILKNIGTAEARNITVKAFLQSDNAAIVGNDIFTGANLTAGQSENATPLFILKINDDALNNDDVILKMQITTDGGEVFEQILRIKIEAPELIVAEVFIEDQEVAKPNARLDEGETADLCFRIKNISKFPIRNASLDIVKIPSFIQVLNLDKTMVSLDSGQMETVKIKVSVNSKADKYAPVQVKVNCTMGLRTMPLKVRTMLSLVKEGFESGDLKFIPWDEHSDWIVYDSIKLEGKYAAKSNVLEDETLTTLKLGPIECLSYDSITFFIRLEGDIGQNGRLNFLINGVDQKTWVSRKTWFSATFPVVPGFNTFEWQYFKQYEIENYNYGRVFIDNITIPHSLCYNASEENEESSIIKPKTVEKGVFTIYQTGKKKYAAKINSDKAQTISLKIYSGMGVCLKHIVLNYKIDKGEYVFDMDLSDVP